MSLNLNQETEDIIASVVAITAADYLDAQTRHEKLAEISSAVDEAMFDLEALHGIDPLRDFDDEDEVIYEIDEDDDFEDDDDDFGYDEDEDDEYDDFTEDDEDFEDDEDDEDE